MINLVQLRKHRVKRDVLGFRLPMLTHEEPEPDISEIIVMHPDNTFFMRMGSEAMVSYHILPDHVLVIDRTMQPVNGSIVVFYHNSDFFLLFDPRLEGRVVVVLGENTCIPAVRSAMLFEQLADMVAGDKSGISSAPL